MVSLRYVLITTGIPSAFLVSEQMTLLVEPHTTTITEVFANLLMNKAVVAPQVIPISVALLTDETHIRGLQHAAPHAWLQRGSDTHRSRNKSERYNMENFLKRFCCGYSSLCREVKSKGVSLYVHSNVLFIHTRIYNMR